MDTGDLIDAVKSHWAVEFLYRGPGGLEPRVVHPHAVYRSSSGALRLDGVQLSGATTSGSLPGWRNFDLMRIAGLQTLDTVVRPADDFNRSSERYRHGLLACA